LFGIKSFPGCHGTQLLATREWFSPSQAAAFTATNAARTAVMHAPQERDTIGRYLYDCQDEFATFPTLAACFAKRAELFSAGPYAPFAAAYRDTGDLNAYIGGIGPIYATAPNYAAMLREIIDEPSVRAALTAARATASISA
jgi:flagellum-specific peptidoglycan hydrolase FlgJ